MNNPSLKIPQASVLTKATITKKIKAQGGSRTFKKANTGQFIPTIEPTRKSNRYLLDTHILLWYLENRTDMMASKWFDEISDTRNRIIISSISTWEISIKCALGKLSLNKNIYQLIKSKNFEELPVTFSHTNHFREIPILHKDPFDRMLITQAVCENLTLITRDLPLTKYNAKVLLVS